MQSSVTLDRAAVTFDDDRAVAEGAGDRACDAAPAATRRSRFPIARRRTGTALLQPWGSINDEIGDRMLNLARAASTAGRAHKAIVRSAGLLDQAAALPAGSPAQNRLIEKAVNSVNRTTFKTVLPSMEERVAQNTVRIEQRFQSARQLADASRRVATPGLRHVNGKLSEASTDALGIRVTSSATNGYYSAGTPRGLNAADVDVLKGAPRIDLILSAPHVSRPLADMRASAASARQQLDLVMPELRTAARGQRLVAAGVGGVAALGTVGGAAYLASR